MQRRLKTEAFVLARMWYATPSNNKVGYFYLAGHASMAKNSGQ